MSYLVYLLGFLLLLIIGVQLSMLVRARRQQGKPAPVVDGLLTEEQHNEERLLYYFYSEQCAPCRQVSQLVDHLAESHGNIVKVDVRQRPDVARSFVVMGTPTLVQVKAGAIAHVHMGGITEAKVKEML